MKGLSEKLLQILVRFLFQVKEKKYETVGTTSRLLAASMHMMGASNVNGNTQPFKTPIQSL